MQRHRNNVKKMKVFKSIGTKHTWKFGQVRNHLGVLGSIILKGCIRVESLVDLSRTDRCGINQEGF